MSLPFIPKKNKSVSCFPCLQTYYTRRRGKKIEHIQLFQEEGDQHAPIFLLCENRRVGKLVRGERETVHVLQSL